MDKTRLIFFMMSLAAACNSTRICLPSDDPENYGQEEGILAVAVGYPDNYNWRRDSIPDEIRPCLLFFRDTSLLLRFEAGKDAPGADADRHWIRSGKLYSYANTSGGTAIFCNGRRICQFENRELVTGLMVTDSCIYTLGLDTGNGGWNLRENGRRILSRDKGEPLGGLYSDNGEICFAYRMPSSQTLGKSAYFFVSDGRDSLLSLPSGTRTVRAIRRYGGIINLLYEDDGDGVLWTRDGTRIADISFDGATDYIDSRFITCSTGIMAVISSPSPGGRISGIWDGGSGHRLFRTAYNADSRLCSICDGKGELCFATSLDGGNLLDCIYLEDTTIRLPQRFTLRSPSALCSSARSFALGVNDVKENYRPEIISGDDTLKYDFNGYFIQLALP